MQEENAFFTVHYQQSIGSVMVKTLDLYSEGKRIETGLREGKKSAAGCAIFSWRKVEQHKCYIKESIMHFKCKIYTFCLHNYRTYNNALILLRPHILNVNSIVSNMLC